MLEVSRINIIMFIMYMYYYLYSLLGIPSISSSDTLVVFLLSVFSLLDYMLLFVLFLITLTIVFVQTNFLITLAEIFFWVVTWSFIKDNISLVYSGVLSVVFDNINVFLIIVLILSNLNLHRGVVR